MINLLTRISIMMYLRLSAGCLASCQRFGMVPGSETSRVPVTRCIPTVAKSAYCYVRPSARMHQRGSH